MEEKTFTPEDIEKNKTISMLAYLLFFLPLVSCKDSQFGRFHSNQGLLLLLVCIAGSIVISILTAISWRLWWISSILSTIWGLAMFALCVMSMIKTYNGKAEKLPVIGNIQIIK